MAVSTPAPDPERGVYGISVAAELVGMGTQTLRLYETRGLLEPERTDGGTRRYSENDLLRLRRIRDLVAEGLNLSGVVLVLRLESDNARLRAERDELRDAATSSADAPASPRPRRVRKSRDDDA
jgi:MerR family transcriptional regulator, heat shock protein HspR